MITKGKMLLSFYIFSPLIFQELYGDQFGENFFLTRKKESGIKT